MQWGFNGGWGFSYGEWGILNGERGWGRWGKAMGTMGNGDMVYGVSRKIIPSKSCNFFNFIVIVLFNYPSKSIVMISQARSVGYLLGTTFTKYKKAYITI